MPDDTAHQVIRGPMVAKIDGADALQVGSVTGDCAIGVVTYNPDLRRLAECVSAVSHEADLLIVVDNASQNVDELQSLLPGFPTAMLVKNSSNLGVARALNQVASLAAERGKSQVLLLDQDSVPANGLLNELRRHAASEVGIVCPQVRDRNERAMPRERSGVHEVTRAITSGSLLSLDAWHAVEGYDERLFVDWVDFEFCDNLRAHGFRILRNFDAGLLHELGRMEHAISVRRGIGTGRRAVRDYYRTNHPAFRIRDKARSQVLTVAKYWKHSTIRNEELEMHVKGSLLAILLERHRVRVAVAIGLGVCDALALLLHEKSQPRENLR